MASAAAESQPPPELEVPRRPTSPRSKKGSSSSKTRQSVKRSPSNPFFMLSAGQDRKRSGVSRSTTQVSLSEAGGISPTEMRLAEGTASPGSERPPSVYSPSDDVSVPTASGALNTAPEGSDSASFNAIKTGLRQRLASDDHSRLGGRNRQSSNASLFSVTSATSNPPSRSRKDSAASTVSLQPPPSGATPISAAQLRPRATSSNKLHKRRPGQSHDVSNQQHPQHEEVRGHAASRSISSVIEAQPELLSPHGFQPYGTSSQEEDAEFSSPVSDLGSFSAAGPSDQGSMVGQISPREKASGFGLGATSPRLESERLVVYHDDEDDTDAFGQSKSRRKVPRYSWLALAHWILSSPIYAPLRFLSFIPLLRLFIPQLEKRPTLSEMLYDTIYERRSSDPMQVVSRDRPGLAGRSKDGLWIRLKSTIWS